MITRAGFIRTAAAAVVALFCGCRRQPAFPLGQQPQFFDASIVRDPVDPACMMVGRSVGKSLDLSVSEWVTQAQLARKHAGSC